MKSGSFLIIFFQITYVFSNDPPSRFDLFNTWQGEEEQEACGYKIGEERKIKTKWGFWDFLNNKGYLVKREDKDNYTVSIALKFSAARDYNGTVPRAQVHEHYMQKVRSCMENEVNPYMLGPAGKKLKIEILERGVKSNVPTHSILIVSNRHRGTYKKYPFDIDCETIAHEILHLLGLTDEYSETHAGHHVNPKNGEVHSRQVSYFAGYQFNCRVVQSNSIMADHHERFQSVRKSVGRRGEGCPPLSLLDPIHFDAIIYGRCKDREDLKLYRECASISYKDSRLFWGCKRKKKECESRDVLGRSRADELNCEPRERRSYRRSRGIR